MGQPGPRQHRPALIDLGLDAVLYLNLAHDARPKLRAGPSRQIRASLLPPTLALPPILASGAAPLKLLRNFVEYAILTSHAGFAPEIG